MRTRWVFAIALVLACRHATLRARADEAPPSGDQVVERVNARDEGESVTRTWVMDLVEKDGSTRSRTLRSYRRRFGTEKRSFLVFEDPPNVKGTALLTWDYLDPQRPDDQWLYLPALRKSRRVALSDRGRAFLGTDFSFEDMKRETQLNASDYTWRTVGEEVVDGHRCWVVEARTADARIALELGHERVLLRIDAEIYFPRFAEYWAVGGAPQKTIRLSEIESVQGIWTAQRIEARDLATDHRTILRFRDIDYRTPIPEDQFSEAALRRGEP